MLEWWHFLCTRTQPTTRWTRASMWGTHQSRLRLWRGSMLNALSQVPWGGSNSSESAPYFPTLNPNRSKFGSRIEGVFLFKISNNPNAKISHFLFFLKKSLQLHLFFLSCLNERTQLFLVPILCFFLLFLEGIGEFWCVGVVRSRGRKLLACRQWTESWLQWTSC